MSNPCSTEVMLGGDELFKIYDRGYLDVSRKEVWWFRVVQLLKNARQKVSNYFLMEF